MIPNAWVVVATIFLSYQQPIDSIPADSVCSHGRGFVGACTTIRGRLRAYSDNVSIRIWPVGTTRLLGVQDERSSFYLPVTCRLPSDLDALIQPDVDVYANFVVRPLTRTEPDVMQRVCVASAKNVRVVHRTPPGRP